MGLLVRARARRAVILVAGLAPWASACSSPAPPAPPVLPPAPTAASSASVSASAIAAPAPTPLRDAISLGAGARHACARLASGAVACWGANDRGQLGEVVGASSALAVVVPGIARAVELSASPGDFACVRHDDGGVSCWGHDTRRPARIGGIASAVQIAAGDGAVACAVLVDTTVRCWTMDDVGKPAVDPAPGLRDVVEVAVAADHTCARLKSGAVSCWGDNCSGQLGDGTREARGAPVTVVDLPRAIGVAVSPARSCAVLPNHALACWGATGWSCEPASPGRCVQADMKGCGYVAGGRPRVVRGVTHVAALSGGRLGCVVLDKGGVACWDSRAEAPTFPGAASPVEGLTGAIAVSSGERHTCALLGDGTVRCWGDAEAGQLGSGTFAPPSAAPSVVLQP
jgi:hypothetical protein